MTRGVPNLRDSRNLRHLSVGGRGTRCYVLGPPHREGKKGDEALIRVYLADDHKMFLRGLTRVFSEDPTLDLVGTAKDGETALAEIMRLEPDVAVLDISMPRMSGLEILAALKASNQPTKVLLLTGTETRETVFEAVRGGVHGFLLKTSDWDDLVAAIKKIVSGETVIGPKAMKLLAGQIQQDASNIGLTDREQQVLSALAQDFDVPEIAARLHVETSTIRTHIRRIYKKLGVSGRGAAVAEAMRRRLID
jgi:two-component system nitrate/nitrite response regulator NarL